MVKMTFLLIVCIHEQHIVRKRDKNCFVVGLLRKKNIILNGTYYQAVVDAQTTQTKLNCYQGRSTKHSFFHIL